jgi:hypothetical protein
VKVPQYLSLEDFQEVSLKDGTLRNDAEWKITFTDIDDKRHSLIGVCSAMNLRFLLADLFQVADIKSVIIEQLGNASR